MGVHYERGAVGEIKSMGFVPATIDIGGAISFQGGVSKTRQGQLLRLITTLQEEWDAACSGEPITTEQHQTHNPGTGISKPTAPPISPISNGTAPPTAPAGKPAPEPKKPAGAK